MFAAGATSVQHVETITRALTTPAAGRLTPAVWAGAEDDLADKATLYTPTELGDDTRGAPERQADALTELCGYVLTHGAGVLPACGGERPHLNVIVGLEDLEDRACAAMLDFGGRLSPEQLRLLACDARVVPVVMNGAGQPLDVGRASRTIPDGLRRAVAARDRGCAHPGCGRTPSWCEVHHIRAWEDHGHRDRESGHVVPLPSPIDAQGRVDRPDPRRTPRVRPPKWIDLEQRPRRKPSILTS